MLFYAINVLLTLQRIWGLSIFTPESIQASPSPRIKVLKDLLDKNDYSLSAETVEDLRRNKYDGWSAGKFALYNIPTGVDKDGNNITTSDPKLFNLYDEYIKKIIKLNHEGTPPNSTTVTTKKSAAVKRRRSQDQGRVVLISNPEILEDFRRKKQASTSSSSSEPLEKLTTSPNTIGTYATKGSVSPALQDGRTIVISNPEVLEQFMKKKSTTIADPDKNLRRTFKRKPALRGLEQEVTSFKPHYESDDEANPQSPENSGPVKYNKQWQAGIPNEYQQQDNFNDRNVNPNTNIEWKKGYNSNENKYNPQPHKILPNLNWQKFQAENVNNWGPKQKERPQHNWDLPKETLHQLQNDYQKAKEGRAKLANNYESPLKLREIQEDYAKAKQVRERLRNSLDADEKKPQNHNPERDWRNVGVNQESFENENETRKPWNNRDRTTKWKKQPFAPMFETRGHKPKNSGNFPAKTEVPWRGKKSVYEKSEK